MAVDQVIEPLRYHETRFAFDQRRAVVWRTLVRSYFQQFVGPAGSVLEIGAGYCDFINNIQAGRKYAVDIWPEFKTYAEADVETFAGDAAKLDFVPDNSLDLVFASNVLEHLSMESVGELLASVRAKLAASGRLVLLQPNYYFAYREYYDDYTHRSVWTHVSLGDFLAANGMTVEQLRPRFLPLSMKSRLPTWPFLIQMYLRLPFKVFGKQMLIVARKSQGSS